MSIQRYPKNPIEQRKQEVRANSRNALVSVVGGGVGGAIMWLMTRNGFWISLGLVIAIVGGGYFYTKVRKIINQKDNQ